MPILSRLCRRGSFDGTNSIKTTELEALVLVSGTMSVEEKRAIINRTSIGVARLSTLDRSVGRLPKNALFLYLPSAQDEGYSKSLSHARGLLANLTAEGIPVAATIHLHDISQKRMTQAAQDDLKVACNVVAEYSSYDRVVFVTTDWHSDSITELHGLSRERELKNNYWKRPIQRGATLVRVGYRAKGKALDGGELDMQPLGSILAQLLASCADRVDADVDPRLGPASVRLCRRTLRRIKQLFMRCAGMEPHANALATSASRSVAGTSAREGLPD